MQKKKCCLMDEREVVIKSSSHLLLYFCRANIEVHDLHITPKKKTEIIN